MPEPYSGSVSLGTRRGTGQQIGHSSRQLCALALPVFDTIAIY
ncbi:MAG: hypothetical protein ACI87W_003426, partial [Halieaceae bacterium]